TGNSNSSSSSVDDDGIDLNRSTSLSESEGNNLNFGNTINYNKAFEKKARNFSFIFSNNNTSSDSETINISNTQFFQDNKPDDERNQQAKRNNTNDSYSAELEYTEPITDSLR